MSRLFAVLLALTTFVPAAAAPEYLAKALRNFPRSVIPANLAYEMEVARNGHRTRERFDPAAPADGKWVLIEFAGRTPTTDEIAQHRVARARSGQGASFQADFTAVQIDRSSLRLERDDDETAVFSGGFTEDASDGDALLGRLTLRLTVDKRRAEITAYELRLQQPYSPVLGVKISELVAGVEFHRPPGLDLVLPRRTWSHFKGRIFLSATQEELEVRYDAFRRFPAESAAREAGQGERGH